LGKGGAQVEGGGLEDPTGRKKNTTGEGTMGKGNHGAANGGTKRAQKNKAVRSIYGLGMLLLGTGRDKLPRVVLQGGVFVRSKRRGAYIEGKKK